MLNKLIAGAPIWTRLRDKAGRLRLYYHTLRHLKHEQITGRILRRVRKQVGIGKCPDAPGNLINQLSSKIPFPESASESLTRKDITQGRFCFLNEWCDLGQPVNWQPDMPLLWQFNLHYFDYLHLLEPNEQHALCRDWMARNPVGAQPGWHPYPTSLRIINWCKAELQDRTIHQSLYRQAAYLQRNLETHLLGNHLLENARALVFAGSFFGDHGEACEWFQNGIDVYREQTPEQILADGGHFERSPMYHALMLEGYVDVLNLLPDDHSDRSWLTDTVRAMSDFLVSMTHPSGRIALFNDATREIACSTDRLLTYVDEVLDYQPERKHSFEETGYYIHTTDDVYLVIDGGPIGPDYLPAHAHADIFTYELSIGGVPFIVDTGVYSYESGSMRDYVRSTRAHNTVCVDGVDQAECWDRFRVARRYPPRDVSFAQQDNRSVFEGTFDGYSHLIGGQIEHRRRIEADGGEQCIIVKDDVTGHGKHTVRSRIHFHPDVDVRQEGRTIQLQRNGQTILLSTGDSQVWVDYGWYCPEFGYRIECNVIVLKADGALPAHLTYRIDF